MNILKGKTFLPKVQLTNKLKKALVLLILMNILKGKSFLLKVMAEVCHSFFTTTVWE